MATNFSSTSGVSIHRATVTSNGVSSDPDQYVKGQLDGLHKLLKTPFIPKRTAEKTAWATPKKGETTLPPDPSLPDAYTQAITDLFNKPLTARVFGDAIGGTNMWEGDDNLLATIYPFAFPKKGTTITDRWTIEEFIDATPTLSLLKYNFISQLKEYEWVNLDYNTQTVLSYINPDTMAEGEIPAVVYYLITYSYLIGQNSEINGMINFILGNKANGKDIVVRYAQVSTARQYIHEEKLDINYNRIDSSIIQNILASKPQLSSYSFKAALQKVLDTYIADGREYDLIIAWSLNNNAQISPEWIPALIQKIKNYPIKIDSTNIDSVMPMFLNELNNNPAEVASAGKGKDSTLDFNVEFLDDDSSVIQVITGNIRCAAQMYYAMTLGDELNIFDVVNYFTHKYMIRGNVQISDDTLREDLQLYVFSNKFTSLRTGKIVDRSRPAERHMFYKQVFNWGAGQVTEDVVVNKEFNKLWRILIMESAKYIQRAQDSPNPDQFVSRQPVMQAVEDIQYNLSTHCSGMANVITPIIYDELNFIIKRILNNKEIISQLVPAGGTWWKVVELLYEGMKQQRPKSTVLYNKAKLGFEILSSAANYNPRTFENSQNFSDFISNVDAFIITQAQLQKTDDDDDTKPNYRDRDGDRDRDRDHSGRDSDVDQPGERSSVPAGVVAKDDWAF